VRQPHRVQVVGKDGDAAGSRFSLAVKSIESRFWRTM
jgi:hypothetical protein